MDPHPGPLARDTALVRTADASLLTRRDAVLLTVGLIIGAGIFRAPSVVAANAGSAELMLFAWLLGGLVSLAGALCYAELASTYPSTGGDYHFLRKAYGERLAFLYAWARMTVIQTGSIALLGFTFGDYASRLLWLGPASPAVYAGMLVIALTGVHLAGLRFGARTQNLLTSLEVAGVALVIAAGLLFGTPHGGEAAASAGQGSFGLMMVFVLLTFGGWSEAAYLSAELREGRRGITRILVVSLVLVTALYLAVNLAYLNTLGLSGMAGTETVAASAMERAFGPLGAAFIAALIAVAVLTSVNATIFTGARSANAVGQHMPALRWLGVWSRRATPGNALLAQAAIALALIAAGGYARKGFETIVEFTAPVFWLFLLLVGVALFVLRRREPGVDRPFRVPGYPLVPLLFCATSAYMLHASLAYTGKGAVVGVAVLALGLVAHALASRARA